MKIIDFDDMRYAGTDGETVTITVEPNNTVQIVTYTLNGDGPHSLKQGESITFTLKKNQDSSPTVLQMTFDFTDDNGGSYRVGLKTVEGEPNNEAVYTVDGPPFAARTFRFFVN
jgi:hypothetical protein